MNSWRDGRCADLVAARERDLLGAVEGSAFQVAHGLAKAHEAGIVHRDIKADNIMSRRTATRRSWTRPCEAPRAGRSSVRTLRVLPPGLHYRHEDPGGARARTVGYMSPEQARGRALDQRSDIFSLGIVLYEMVTGQAPFGAAPHRYPARHRLRGDPPRHDDPDESARQP